MKNTENHTLLSQYSHTNHLLLNKNKKPTIYDKNDIGQFIKKIDFVNENGKLTFFY